MTRWVKAVQEDELPSPGVHYVINDAFFENHADYVPYPATTTLRTAFRHQWVMRRNNRPLVPQLDSAPMPNREATAIGRAKLLSVYLRPWVLDPADASDAVVHISALDIVSNVPDGIAQDDGKRRRLMRKSSVTGATEHRNYVHVLQN